MLGTTAMGSEKKNNMLNLVKEALPLLLHLSFEHPNRNRQKYLP